MNTSLATLTAKALNAQAEVAYSLAKPHHKGNAHHEAAAVKAAGVRLVEAVERGDIIAAGWAMDDAARALTRLGGLA